jgi:hypothetical protein
MNQPKANPVPYFFYSDKCGHCKKLSAFIRQNPQFAESIRWIQIENNKNLPPNLESVPSILFNGRMFKGEEAFAWVQQQYVYMNKMAQQAQAQQAQAQAQQVQTGQMGQGQMGGQMGQGQRGQGQVQVQVQGQMGQGQMGQGPQQAHNVGSVIKNMNAQGQAQQDDLAGPQPLCVGDECGVFISSIDEKSFSPFAADNDNKSLVGIYSSLSDPEVAMQGQVGQAGPQTKKGMDNDKAFQQRNQERMDFDSQGQMGTMGRVQNQGQGQSQGQMGQRR